MSPVAVTVPEHRVREWVTAFEAQPPLAAAFPLTLSNGKSVPGLAVVCSACGERLPSDAVHGRVFASLANVVTVEANGHCEPCDRLTHIDCRFRVQDGLTQFDWLGSNGRWLTRECRAPTLFERLVAGSRKLAARFAPAR